MKPIKEAIKNIVDNHTTYADVHPIDIDFDELTTELCKKLEAMYNIVEGEWMNFYETIGKPNEINLASHKATESILQKFNKELNIEE
jgi:hypothetical protein